MLAVVFASTEGTWKVGISDWLSKEAKSATHKHTFTQLALAGKPRSFCSLYCTGFTLTVQARGARKEIMICREALEKKSVAARPRHQREHVPRPCEGLVRKSGSSS